MTVPDEQGRWRKSRRSKEGQDCVEVDMDQPGDVEVGVRDSKAPQAGEIRLSRAGWRALTASVRDHQA
ncbi:DUF397 domain-containing protein [Amycolatopsis kentuckyensis]|uniref:DUF397 domain-containing protein n=1 Tax=Amycolatopsis kentuckyensis TaxID=218823 RepID=UPI0035655DE9